MRKISRRLIQALNNIDEAYYVNEGKRKVSDAELCVMYALDDGLPHSQCEISKEWLVPKTSVNTIIKRWEKDGFLRMAPIIGKRREMNVTLTDAGREYAKSLLAFLYSAEEKALRKTLEKYSDEFIEAIEFFGTSLKEAFEAEAEGEDADNELD